MNFNSLLTKLRRLHPRPLIHLLTYHVALSVTFRHLLLLMHQRVRLIDVAPEVLHLHLLRRTHLIRVSDQTIIKSLRDDLGLLIVSLTGELVRLLDHIHTQDLVIRGLLDMLTVARDLQGLGDHANLAGTV